MQANDSLGNFLLPDQNESQYASGGTLNPAAGLDRDANALKTPRSPNNPG
jgi:hypothetical protein